MKLYEARLDLYYNDDGLKSIFKIEQTKEEYEVLDERRWAKVEHSYLDNTLSKEIELRKMYGNYTLKQGFDKEPTDVESKQIEESMRLHLKEILEYEKEDIINLYDEKLRVLESK